MTIEAGPDDRMDVGANQSDAPADDRLDHEKLNEMPESNARRLTLEGYRANECPWCEEPADAYDCATEWSGTESGGNVMTVTQTCHDCRKRWLETWQLTSLEALPYKAVAGRNGVEMDQTDLSRDRQ